MSQQLMLRFLNKKQLQKKIFIFTFTIEQSSFAFTAGQYLQLTLPHPKSDERGSSRFFTISSAPTEKEVMITTQRGESSFKKALFGLRAGDSVQAFGPMGKFVLEDDVSI